MLSTHALFGGRRSGQWQTTPSCTLGSASGVTGTEQRAVAWFLPQVGAAAAGSGLALANFLQAIDLTTDEDTTGQAASSTGGTGVLSSVDVMGSVDILPDGSSTCPVDWEAMRTIDGEVQRAAAAATMAATAVQQQQQNQQAAKAAGSSVLADAQAET